MRQDPIKVLGMNKDILIMYSRLVCISILIVVLAGCSGREIDILDHNNKVIGGCYGGADWHFYGLQDTIDYQLFSCYKDMVEQGYTISDKSLLEKDFTLPPVPIGYEVWNRKIAMEHFRAGNISEQRLGYVLAAIELEYMKVVWPAEGDLADGKISKAEFNQIEKKARYTWLGE